MEQLQSDFCMIRHSQTIFAQQLGHTLRQVGSGHVGVRVGDQDDAVGGQRRLLAFIGGTGDEPEQDADDDAGRKEPAGERNNLHTPDALYDTRRMRSLPAPVAGTTLAFLYDFLKLYQMDVAPAVLFCQR